MPTPVFSLPKSKYTKDTNSTVGYSYNQSSYAGGFRNDCSGFVSDVLRTNGYAVPKDFTTTNIKSWANKSNPYFESVGTGKSMKLADFKNGDVVMLGSGHTGIVFTDTDQVMKIADWGSNANGFRTNPVKLESALTKNWYGQVINEVIRPKAENYHVENDQTAPGQKYATSKETGTSIAALNAGAGRGFINPPLVSDNLSEQLAKTKPKSDVSDTSTKFPNTPSESIALPTEDKSPVESENYSNHGEELPIQKINELPEPGDAFYDALIEAMIQSDVPSQAGDMYAAIPSDIQTDAGAHWDTTEKLYSLAEFLAGMSGKISADQQASLNESLVQLQNANKDDLGVYVLSGSAALMNKQSHEIVGFIRQRESMLDLLQEKASQTFNQWGQLETSRSIHSQLNANGQQVLVNEVIHHLATGNEIASIKSLVTDSGNSIVNIYKANGHIEEAVYSIDELGKPVMTSSKVISYSQEERNAAVLDVGLAGADFLQSLRTGNKIQAASHLIRLVNNAEIASNKMPTLGAIGTGLTGAVSLLSALDNWGESNEGERVALTARAILGAIEIAKAFSQDGKTGFLESAPGFNAMNIAGSVLALSSLESTIKSGNPFAIASTVMTISNSVSALGLIGPVAAFSPQTMIAVAVASVVFGSLFGGGKTYYPSAPPAGTLEIGNLSDGSLGMLLKDAQGKVYQQRYLTGVTVSNTGKATDSQNWQMGAEILAQRMNGIINQLQVLAEKDGQHVVMNRLPVLSIHAYPSFEQNGNNNFFFSMRCNDPVTGVQQMGVTANQDLAEQFKQMAEYAGVLVSQTEWEHIQLRRKTGVANPTETEGQYVDRMSGNQQGDSLLDKKQADTQVANNRQTYSVMTLDLENNGVTRKNIQSAGMSLADVEMDTSQGRARFDADNDGYMELTEWVGAKEAILGIDRDDDGELNSAKELFTGAELSDAAEGLGINRLAFFDANSDGKIDALDPYFRKLKLWIDLNGDARTGIGELYSLDDASVVSIDLQTGEMNFTDGQQIKIQTTQLTSEVRGVSVYSETGGNDAVSTGHYVVKQESKEAELNLTQDASTDLSDILNLVRPNSNISDAEKLQLKSLADKYGVNLANPSALLGLGGGGQAAGKSSAVEASGVDIFSIDQAPDANEIKQALMAFFSNSYHDSAAGPAIANQLFNAKEDKALKIKAIDLIAGLTDVQLISVQDARRGRVSIDANGDVVFDPLANQHGTSYFTFTVRDSEGRQSTAMAWVMVESVNDGPVATEDLFSTEEDKVLSVSVSQLLANDSDSDISADNNEAINVISVGQTNHGTARLVNNQVEFTPDAEFQGTAHFEYTIADSAGVTATSLATVTVIGQNDRPVLSNNSRKILARPDTLLRIESATLMSYVNDADVIYGDKLTIKNIVSVSAGNAWQQKDGSVLFKAGALGDAVLTVLVTDSQGSTVSVPIAIDVSNNNQNQFALLPGIDQASEDTAVRIRSTLEIINFVESTSGTAFVDQDGSLVFTPLLNYNGMAQVIYSVRDTNGDISQKTADFNIAAVNDAPFVIRQSDDRNMDEDGTLTILQSELLANISDVDILTNRQTLKVTSVGDAVNGIAQLNEFGEVSFKPNKDFNGVASFAYWVSDSEGASVVSRVKVIVRPVNDAPTPMALQFELLEDERRIFSNASLIGNFETVDIDTKTNGDLIKVTAVSMDPANALKGTATVDALGNVNFIPRENYNGDVTFTYTVTDSAGAKGQNTVTLHISAVNDAPTVINNQLNISNGVEDTAKVIDMSDLLKNFNDVEGDALTVKIISDTYGGSIKIDNGQVLFTPVKDFNGKASFRYTVADSSGATASSTASFELVNVNDAPVAAYKRIDNKAYEDTELRIGFEEFTNGAYDADGDKVRLFSVQSPNNASAWIDWSRNQVVFKGNSNFNGIASFEYTLADSNGAVSAPQKFDVNVMAVNDNPLVRAVSGFTVNEDGLESGNNQDPNKFGWIRIGLNSLGATDVDSDPLAFSSFSSFNHIADIRIDGNDALIQLEHNYSGFAGFNYRVKDNQGGWADGQVNFNVLAQNDAPWLVGLTDWPGPATKLNGNFNSRIYGMDIDSPNTNLIASIGKSPIHGDVGLQQSTYQYMRGKSRVTATLPATWELSYKNHYGDEYNGRVGFNVDIKDQQGGWASQYVETYHQGTRASRGGKPVAIDLNGNGIKYTDLDDSKVLFDINGDGVRDLLSWTAAEDGLIVFDKNDDGMIQDLDEVSFLSYFAGSMTDLEGLNGFDTDKDGKLTANDDLWKKFGIWQDKNQDGITDEGEFQRLDSWGIKSVDLSSDRKMDQVGDVYIMGKSTFEWADGRKGEIADAAFRYLDAADTSDLPQAKTFNIDIEGVIRKRIEDAQSHGASDSELNAMLQRFIADVSNSGRKNIEVNGMEATPWSDMMYADFSDEQSKIKQPAV